MQFKIPALALSAVLAGLAPALAQDDAASPETDPGAETEAAEAPTGNDPEELQPGQSYLAEEHGDWELRCIKVEEGPEPCQLYQVLTDENGGPVAEIVVFPLPDDQEAAAGAVVTTPLETLLTEQLTMVIDSGDGRRYPFSFCAEQGCVARVGLTDADLDALRRGNEARVRIVPARAPDQQVLLTASLAGFTAGFAAIEERATE